MRAPILFLLTICLTSPVLAQLQPLNPPVNPVPTASPASSQKLTPDGKVKIGYDKRADYRLITQPTGNPAAATPAAKISNSPVAPNTPKDSLDGTIFNPSTAPQPVAASPAIAAAAAPKPRSDSALRSDASPAKAAAAAAQAEVAAKAVQDKKQADALAAAIAAAQKAGALPLKPQ